MVLREREEVRGNRNRNVDQNSLRRGQKRLEGKERQEGDAGYRTEKWLIDCKSF